MSDIEVARAELADRGVDVSEVYHYAGREGRVSGPDPERRSYASWASFSDPAGNGWLLQEVTARAPGRVDADDTTFVSSAELAAALRRASRPMASTKSGQAANVTRTGRIGTQNTWWPNRPAGRCRCDAKVCCRRTISTASCGSGAADANGGQIMRERGGGLRSTPLAGVEEGCFLAASFAPII